MNERHAKEVFNLGRRITELERDALATRAVLAVISDRNAELERRLASAREAWGKLHKRDPIARVDYEQAQFDMNAALADDRPEES